MDLQTLTLMLMLLATEQTSAVQHLYQANQNTQSEENMSTKQIKLFVYKTCPYCIKVINFLKSIKKLDQVVVLDVSNEANMKELKQLSHNTQCPYLSDEINEQHMPESDDIIAYFKKRFVDVA
jgi:glutaredoxin